MLLLVAWPALAANWKLVWADEFDQPGRPDPAKWTYETGFVRNHEAQLYTRDRAENARVENGVLILEARKEHFKNPAFNPAATNSPNPQLSREFAEYTSASLTTRGRASWTGGRIEVRAKLPAGRGTWPAIWTLGTNFAQVGWPACGEMDIMEFVGFDPGIIHANVHTRKYNHARHNGRGGQTAVPDASTAFHVYALEWSTERLDFFVDDRKYFSCVNEKTGVAAWPFDRDQYLILNFAIGGDWGAQEGIDDAAFPQRFEIDYVRIYRPQP